jgi:hypothetical protein
VTKETLLYLCNVRRIMTVVSFGGLRLLHADRGLAHLGAFRNRSFPILAFIFRNGLIFFSVLLGLTSDVGC